MTTRGPLLILALLAALGTVVVLGWASAALSTAAASTSGPSAEVVLPDSDRTVDELVAAVRSAARDVDRSEPERDLRIVFVSDIPGAEDRPMVAGQQRDSTLFIRIDGVAVPTRTLVHELAHAFAPGDGHGERFRAIYLAAMAEVYDDATAAGEARRLAWVYDKCYLDDSCPSIPRTTRGGSGSPAEQGHETPGEGRDGPCPERGAQVTLAPCRGTRAGDAGASGSSRGGRAWTARTPARATSSPASSTSATPSSPSP